MFTAASKTASSSAPSYIEDVFSTYLYTGNGSTQTITNGIDLAGKGGLVWVKQRGQASAHALFDTARGVSKRLATNGSNPEATVSGVTAFGSTGFTSGSDAETNGLSNTYVGWTFRKQPKFFDIVTYTGNGVARTIAHNLGSVPGCIIVKRTDSTGNWEVYHRSLANTEYVNLNGAGPRLSSSTRWNSTTPTSTVFSVGADTATNANGATYVAYLFAHNAGGFGDSGATNVISCGSYIGNGITNGPYVTIGYEPQWLLIKQVSVTGDGWVLVDTMRGMTSVAGNALQPNVSDAEGTWALMQPIPSGFQLTTTQSAVNAGTRTHIYIAIRRAPMKKPTSGTSVFSANTSSAATGTLLTTNFPVDMQISTARAINVGTQGPTLATRLARVSTNTTSVIRGLVTSTTAAESTTNAFDTLNWGNTGFAVSSSLGGASSIYWNFGRAPGFMDVVTYYGSGSNTTQAHGLGVTPELIIVKRRAATSAWPVYSAVLANTEYLVLNTTAAKATGATYWNSTTPTSTVFSLGTAADVNASGSTYVAYLFASCPGVSKVGTYSGTGGTQTISCGFAVRFVLIKRTDSTGDWWVWDTARGMVAGNDNRQALNTGLAQTNQDWVYTDASGFQIVTTDASVNASGGTYIYLAIA